MDATSVLWVARGLIIGVAVIMFIFIRKWRKEGILRERFHIYFLVLGISTLIIGNFVLTMSLNTNLSSFYGTYIGGAGVVSLIVWLFVRKLTVKSR